ncbi:uncharacterized protein L201_007214 [Kwoniella dendrophila CBS 6074]|uniref:Uncharacterized protein n=1 Tax=Kwoniella dendrophila CBS 6074 TaxID=1295534 RepID=A0AAX4K3R8_9TREE
MSDNQSSLSPLSRSYDLPPRKRQRPSGHNTFSQATPTVLLADEEEEANSSPTFQDKYGFLDTSSTFTYPQGDSVDHQSFSPYIGLEIDDNILVHQKEALIDEDGFIGNEVTDQTTIDLQELRSYFDNSFKEWKDLRNLTDNTAKRVDNHLNEVENTLNTITIDNTLHQLRPTSAPGPTPTNANLSEFPTRFEQNQRLIEEYENQVGDLRSQNEEKELAITVIKGKLAEKDLEIFQLRKSVKQ